VPSALRVGRVCDSSAVPELNESCRWRCGCAPGESVLVGQKLSLGAIARHTFSSANGHRAMA